MTGRGLLAGVVATLALGAAAAALPAAGAGTAGHGSGPTVHATQTGDLSATIRRTAGGIPHIGSSTLAGAAYGYGYAFAQDNICAMAEDYVTVDAQRSRYFGPDGSYLQRGNGISAGNLNSDFFFQQIIDSGIIDKLLATPAPVGPKPELKEGVHGYVEGYNRYLADVGGANGISDPTCRGKPWVHPITDGEAYRRLYQLILLASGDVAIDGIGEAQPPTPSLPLGGGGAQSLDPHGIADGLSKKLPIKSAGSNAVAVGKGGTRDHKHGLLLGNPHFPWLGTERFYQAQMTVPGQVNVEGASLFGVPLVLIGHTANMAWSHTVSTAFRFTPFQLTLVPGSPTTYLYDGQPTAMTSRTVTVQVRQDDGSLKPQTRTLWSTRFGPVFDSLVGVPLPWTPATAFALGDANATNFRAFNHFYDTDRAQSAQQELDILNKYEGIPWVNTIVADRTGHALYADIGTVPNVSNAKAQQCDTAVGAATFKLLGLPVLDGSRSACNWDTDSDSVVPGIFGPSHMPHLFRDDYVTNSNDSYWLANPHQPLTGFARIIGDEGTARSLRTRIGLIMTQARVDGSDHLGPAGFTRRDMQNMVFGDRQYGGELVRDDAVNMCHSFPGGIAPSSSGPVQVGNACDVLAHWDLHENLGSKGDILFRRFWEHALAAEPSGPWKNPFDANDPVHTPNGLNTSDPQVQIALGDAVNDLKGANIPLDASPGDVQYVMRHGRRVPIHGGPGDPDGEFNAIYPPWNGKGYDPNDDGSSYVQVVTWNNGPCPDAATILTYSESTNPDSPFAGDQTELFSRKQWLPERFCGADVRAHTLSTTSVAQGAATRTSGPAHGRKRAKHRRRG
ncbi:MAG: penicillin acylase family protein [Thermoleophilaceae bacterium]